MASVPQARDTGLDAEQWMLEAYRSMADWEKARRLSELCRSAAFLALAGIRERHGDVPEDELRLRLAALRLPARTMRELFSWDPEIKGY